VNVITKEQFEELIPQEKVEEQEVPPPPPPVETMETGNHSNTLNEVLSELCMFTKGLVNL